MKNQIWEKKMENQDQVLYNDFLNGNEKAFEQLVIKYKKNMVYFISRYVKNIENSEDIFQDVMIYVLEHKHDYNNKYSLKTYLYTIAKSKAIDYIRHEKKIEPIDETESLADTKLLEEIILSNERQLKIKNVIDKMPFDYQMVIYLTKIEMLSYKETAIIMEKTEKQIKTLAYNSKKKLRQLLIEERVIEMKNNKVIKLLSIIILVSVCMSGVVFAGVVIYNQFIKQQDEVNSRGLFDTGDGITTYETDLMANDMVWDSEPRLYHKIITNMDDYSKYKSRVSQLPDMTENDFNESFLVIIANENIRQLHEQDLTIYNVLADETTIHITMKQKENPNYNNDNNIWYAIVDKSQLRDNVDVKIEQHNISSEQFVKLENLPKDYTIEQAVNDGCIVTENNKLVSNNLEVLDSFIEKTKNGERSFVRIYIKYKEEITIIDLLFENGIYYECTDSTRINTTKDIKYYYNSFTSIEKNEHDKGITYTLKDKNNQYRDSSLLIIQN